MLLSMGREGGKGEAKYHSLHGAFWIDYDFESYNSLWPMSLVSTALMEDKMLIFKNFS